MITIENCLPLIMGWVCFAIISIFLFYYQRNFIIEFGVKNYEAF